ncbi:rCG49514 [Rattus norvegicus]|uniref:RCG49514 n=1 Tax=Rattus norvegicus TaxID=10116 RepID=A6J3L3_RAT|nr:rCG49514 [Rattus norvegicus]
MLRMRVKDRNDPDVELSATSPAPHLPACHHAAFPGNKGLSL